MDGKSICHSITHSWNRLRCVRTRSIQSIKLYIFSKISRLLTPRINLISTLITLIQYLSILKQFIFHTHMILSEIQTSYLEYNIKYLHLQTFSLLKLHLNVLLKCHIYRVQFNSHLRDKAE